MFLLCFKFYSIKRNQRSKKVAYLSCERIFKPRSHWAKATSLSDEFPTNHLYVAHIECKAKFNEIFTFATSLAMITLLAVQWSAQTFIHNAIFIDTCNNAWYKQAHWLVMLQLNNYDYESEKKNYCKLIKFWILSDVENDSFIVAWKQMRHCFQMASRRIQRNAYIEQRQKVFKNVTFGDVALAFAFSIAKCERALTLSNRLSVHGMNQADHPSQLSVEFTLWSTVITTTLRVYWSVEDVWRIPSTSSSSTLWWEVREIINTIWWMLFFDKMLIWK